MKVWFSLKEHGLQTYQSLVEQNVAQAQYLGEMIAGDRWLELLAPIPLNVVCFRYRGNLEDEATMKQLNQEILLRLQESGVAAPSATVGGWRPDLNPADYPNFPGAVSVAGYPSEAAFATAFSNALGIGSGPVSQVNVPQTLIGATGNYHFGAGFDAGLRFNYGSYTDNTIWNTAAYRPNVNGKLQSYSVFFGRVW